MAEDRSAGREPEGLVSHTGRTRDGNALAFNDLPAGELVPWISWLSVSDADIPAGATITDGMLNDHAVIRIIFGGRWIAQTRDGERVFETGDEGMTLYFGPQTEIMRLSVQGRIKVLTVHFGPGAAAKLGGPLQHEMLDRIIDYDKLIGKTGLNTRFDINGSPQEWLETINIELKTFLNRRGRQDPDRITQAFERQTLIDPSFVMADFADEQECSTRTVERVVKRDYGMSPKQVCRRARALDIASALLGVAMEEEEAALRLRYFDQSHLIREVKTFFGTTPHGLKVGNHPLLRINLEIRQARRVQALALLPPGAIEPWRDPDAEPYSEDYPFRLFDSATS